MKISQDNVINRRLHVTIHTTEFLGMEVSFYLLSFYAIFMKNNY